MTSVLNVSPDLLVPFHTALTQDQSSITSLADGGYIIAWVGLVGSSDAIFSQRYDGNGHKVGAEQQVDTKSANFQRDVSVSSLADGGYVIAWAATFDPSDHYDVVSQRYDHDGNVVVPEGTIYGGPFADLNVHAAGLANGAIAYVYEAGYSATDSDIDVRIYLATGDYVTTTVVAGTSLNENYPSIAPLADGDMVVSFFTGSSFAFRLVSGTGALLGNAVTLSNIAIAPGDVTALPDGGFVATWTAGNSSARDIFVQTFDSSGRATGAATVANSAAVPLHSDSVVTALDDGGYVVIWDSLNQDGWGSGIYGQRFDASHAAVGDEFQVNSFILNNQVSPAVTALANGGFVVSWTSDGQDGSGTGIYQKVYSNATTTVGNQTLWGTHDGDILDGGSGNDIMYGGFGDDVYVVGSVGDIVHEGLDQGSDTIEAYVTLAALADNVENLTLMGSGALNATGNALDNTLVGNAGANIIKGGDGDDTIDGGSGADKLDGGAGDDTINGGNGNDIIYASDGQDFAGGDSGIDTYDASTGTGAAKINLASRSTQNGYTTYLENIENVIGTAFADSITGTNGDNVINGRAGADKMAGGLGDDTYYVDNIGDVVADSSDAVLGGTDTVLASIAYTLGSYIENLTLTGGDAINGSGNSLDNILVGNSGNNILDGKAGNDAMSGGLGDDTYYVDAAGDTVVELAGQGTDTVRSSVSYALGQNVENVILTGTANINGTGNGDANSLTGNSGNNTLDGGAGADVMAGGNGDDNYYVDNSGDVVADSSDATLGGHDQVISSITYVLGNYIEDLLLTGTANINGTGNALNNIVVGNDGSNILDGKAGSDTMTGGLGDDTYVVDVAGDVVVEQAAQGTDTVKAGLSYVLGANVENLILTGTGNFNGTGNGDANTITGNAGNNIIDGGAGADIMAGGLGDDTYIVDNVGDVVNDYSGAGNDTILASVSYTLSGRYVETLQLTGSANINAIGNAQDNRLVSNAGNNSLTGGTGADTFAFLLGSHADTITDFTVADNDTIDATAYHAVAHTVTQSGTSVIIDFGSGNTVTVLKTNVADVNAHTVF